jgi:choline kinase
MISIELSSKETNFLVALLESDKQTALQLLAADHFYEPSLLPKLRKAQREIKKQKTTDLD